jgi:hypothetical protein
MANQDKMIKIIDKCEFLFDNCIFSNEPIIIDFWHYLSNKTIDHKSTNLNLYAGSILFDITIIFYSAFLALENNKVNVEDTIFNLEKGSIVIYEDGRKNNSRYIFLGTESRMNTVTKGMDNYAIIEQDCISRRVPSKLWNRIRPYYGPSTSLGGKGIRKGNEIVTDFYKEVLDIGISNLVNTSSIIIAKKIYFDEYLDKCSIRFSNKEIKLCELVTSSYYTENAIIKHGGNITNADPILKFTYNVEIARKETIDKDNNYACGVFVLGDDIINKNSNELQHIYNRKSLPIFLASARKDLFTNTDEIFDSSNCDVDCYVCSKEKINKFLKDKPSNNKYALELYDYCDNIQFLETETKIVAKPIELDDYLYLKKKIKNIKNSSYDSADKADFVIDSFSMLRTFTTLPFTIDDMDSIIKKYNLNIETLKNKLEKLKNRITKLPDYLLNDCNDVVDFLEILSDVYKTNNCKKNSIIEILEKYSDKNIVLIVSKLYYADILVKMGISNIMTTGKLVITTPKKFDHNKIYDLIIATSDFNNDGKFNQFECISTRKIITLLFEHERRFYVYNKRKNDNKLKRISKQEITKEENEFYNRESEWLNEYRSIDNEINNYIVTANRYSDYRRYVDSNGVSNKFTDTIAVATFENGNQAYFTKMYKAYVFDAVEHKVKEKSVDTLIEGDELLFIRANDNTRDIVDEILVDLINDNKLQNSVIQSYKKSKIWKNKLKEYMELNNLTATELARGLKQTGIEVIEQTIIGWLDDGARTVGPKNPESIEHIGYYIGDEDLAYNYRDYHNACSEIRSIRLKILNQIGETIVMKMSNKLPKADSIYEKIYEKVDKLGNLLRIDTITFVKNSIPLNMTNRPLSVKE